MEETTKAIFPQRPSNRCSLSPNKVQEWLEERGVYFASRMMNSCEAYLHTDGWLFIKIDSAYRYTVHDPMEILWDGQEGKKVLIINTHNLKKNGLNKPTNIEGEAYTSISVKEFLVIAAQDPLNIKSFYDDKYKSHVFCPVSMGTILEEETPVNN
jgi:hypothetical protein